MARSGGQAEDQEEERRRELRRRLPEDAVWSTRVSTQDMAAAFKVCTHRGRQKQSERAVGGGMRPSSRGALVWLLHGLR